MRTVRYFENRAGRKARTERAAQRTPFPSTPLGNPSVDAMRDELSKVRSHKAADRSGVGYPGAPATDTKGSTT